MTREEYEEQVKSIRVWAEKQISVGRSESYVEACVQGRIDRLDALFLGED